MVAVEEAAQAGKAAAFVPDETWPARALLMDVYYAQTLCWQVRQHITVVLPQSLYEPQLMCRPNTLSGAPTALLRLRHGKVMSPAAVSQLCAAVQALKRFCSSLQEASQYVDLRDVTQPLDLQTTKVRQASSLAEAIIAVCFASGFTLQGGMVMHDQPSPRHLVRALLALRMHTAVKTGV